MKKSDDGYILYCRGESGNCYKVALMLNLCGLSWRPRFVNFFDAKTKPAFCNEVSDMGELPVLQDGDHLISQSGVILAYLSEKTGRFEGKTNAERREVLRWILFDNHRFTPSYATLRFMKGIRKLDDGPVTEWLRGQAEIALEIVERRLAQRPFITGDTPTLADISMCAYYYYQEETGLNLSNYPNIMSWLDRIAKLPGWSHPYELMPRAMPSAEQKKAVEHDRWP